MNAKELSVFIKESLEIDWIPEAKKGEFWLENVCGNDIEYMHFGTLKTQKGFKIIGEVSFMKTFNSVETILEKYYQEYSIDHPKRTLNYPSTRNENIVNHEIIERGDILVISDWLREIVNEGMFFFEDVKSLELASQKIELTEDLSSILYPPADIKAIVIYALTKSNKFDSLSDETMMIYKEQSNGPYKEYFEKYWQFLPDLIEELRIIYNSNLS